jgi:CubicO group peptidase (beta-lactamase class C family)
MSNKLLPSFEAFLTKAVQDGIIPGAVVVAKSHSGKLDYTYATGSAAPNVPITPETVFALASMTKLITTIALLQLVEQEKVGVDEDVTRHVPDLAKQPILLEDGRVKPRTAPITLRHLITHTSGVGYPMMESRLAEHKKAHSSSGSDDPRAGKTVPTRYDAPLLFEPGSAWKYGASIDWAGQVLEAITGQSLEEYCQAHVLRPLGISPEHITFFPAKQKGLVGSAKMAAMSVRGQDERVRFVGGKGRYDENEDAFGGEGMFADIPSYTKILHSLLLDDGKLLSREMAAEMFKPALPTERAKRSLLKELETPEWIVGDVPHTGEYDWGLGGLLVDGDGHEYRKKGMLFWGGMFNLTWFVDREAGVCGAFGTQVLPAGDAKVRDLHREFERVVYETAKL